MLAFFGLSSFITFIVFLVIVIRKAIKKISIKKSIVFMSVFFVIFVICVVNTTPTPPSTKEVATSNAETTSPTETSKKDTVAIKQTAIDTDKQIYDIVTRAEKTNSIIQKSIDELSKGNMSELDLYDSIKTGIKNMDSFTSSLTDIQSDNATDYIQACQMYVYDSRNYLESTNKYIESQNIKDLSASKDSLQYMSDDAISLSTERMKFLSDSGASSDEITNILGE